jgi:regulatory protein
LNRKRRLKPASRAQQQDNASRDQGEVGVAAVALLARRDYGSAELTALLRDKGFAASAVHAVVSDLIEHRFIDDARYANHRTSYQAERGHGPLRIRRDLLQLGLEPHIIEDAVAQGRDWSQQAREVRIRKFGLDVPTDWIGKARQARFLQYRGFSADHIRSALGATVLDDAGDTEASD